jgi:hypothetical protein
MSLGVLEDRGVLRQVGADQVAHLRVLAVEEGAERGDVDLRRDVQRLLGLLGLLGPLRLEVAGWEGLGRHAGEATQGRAKYDGVIQ